MEPGPWTRSLRSQGRTSDEGPVDDNDVPLDGPKEKPKLTPGYSGRSKTLRSRCCPDSAERAAESIPSIRHSTVRDGRSGGRNSTRTLLSLLHAGAGEDDTLPLPPKHCCPPGGPGGDGDDEDDAAGELGSRKRKRPVLAAAASPPTEGLRRSVTEVAAADSPRPSCSRSPTEASFAPRYCSLSLEFSCRITCRMTSSSREISFCHHPDFAL